MRGNGRVPDKRRFLAGVEEPQANIVIGGGCGRYECHFGLRKLARDGDQGGIVAAIGIEDHGGRVAAEASASERVYLEYAQANLRGLDQQFCTHPSVRLHFVEPWGGLYET